MRFQPASSRRYFLPFLIIVLLSACTKQERDEAAPGPATSSGEVVPEGFPDGSMKTEEKIGAEGGSLKSTDGQLEVIVPPGALKLTQTISIERISNTNPLGRNMSYRITPHNIKFEKPVRLVFDYQKASAVSSLGIAYQDSEGVWQAVGGKLIDETKKKISISTSHFSDWSLFDCLFMIPQKGMVQPGQTIALEVYAFEDLLSPLVSGEEKPISKPVRLAEKYIKKWQLVGPGSLKAQRASAKYLAPDGVPDPNHATVNTELDLGVKGKYLLVTPIEILYSAVRLTLDNHLENVYESAVAWVNGDQVTISASHGDGLRVLINWRGGLGLHTFASEPLTQFGWFPDDQSQYVSFYTDPITYYDLPSGGGINVTDMGLTDGYIKGTLEINPIGMVGSTRINPAGIIKGSFQVKMNVVSTKQSIAEKSRQD